MSIYVRVESLITAYISSNDVYTYVYYYTNYEKLSKFNFVPLKEFQNLSSDLQWVISDEIFPINLETA